MNKMTLEEVKITEIDWFKQYQFRLSIDKKIKKKEIETIFDDISDIIKKIEPNIDYVSDNLYENSAFFYISPYKIKKVTKTFQEMTAEKKEKTNINVVYEKNKKYQDKQTTLTITSRNPSFAYETLITELNTIPYIETKKHE